VITTLVAPAARRGGTTDAPSGKVRLARGLNAPLGGDRLARGLNALLGGVRLARGLNAPSARTASLEGTCTHVVPTPAPVYGYFMLCHYRTRATTLTRLGITPRRCSTDSPGRPSLPLCNTVPPTPIRLTHRAFEGGPAEPSNAFPVTTQGYAVTSGRRERTSSSLSALCGHPRPCSTTPSTVTTSLTLLECTGTGRRHDRHYAAYGPPVDGTLEPARGRRPDNQPLHRHLRSCSCTSTGCSTTPRLEQDSPGRPSAP
jgi:hypothetical protein